MQEKFTTNREKIPSVYCGFLYIPSKRAKRKSRKSVPALRLLKKLRRIFRVSEKQSLKHFVSGRVPDTKYFSGCKCTSCAPTAHKECAQQTAKNWRKRPQAFFDKLKSLPFPGGIFLSAEREKASPCVWEKARWESNAPCNYAVSSISFAMGQLLW